MDLSKIMPELELKLEKVEEQREQIISTIQNLKQFCDHDWRYSGTGYHGSDKDVDFYKCTICKETKGN